MTDTSVMPASPNFEKLKGKLRELFELDKADLDFGIYRILRQRHAELTEFLDRHLEKTVREALQSHGSFQQAQIEGELRKAEASARDAGFEPDQSPTVQKLRARLAGGIDLDATADEVYSHLLTFFSRYYQEGDFLGLHRSTVHGREKYMIPYNGEEVKLIWANMDQYYIKSSELLRDYTFRVRHGDLSTEALDFGDAEQAVIVHFKLVEGDTEKDNRKPDGKTTRAFTLDAEQPFVEVDETTLNIRFRYREQAAERDLQKKLNIETEKTLADNLPARWRGLLFADDPTYQSKDNKDKRTVLQKHLRSYTAKHQFDYFIHKDLGGFLRRELDFYIKNEVMHLDDIEDSAASKAEEYLSKIRALRRCALPIIRMLEQLENFQKKLWLKKKFVVETRYCVTLDRVPEALYKEICANDAQWAEWEELYAISEIEAALFSPKARKRTPEFLKANPYLMLDTRHFSREFMLKLLTSIENLDETLDGICFNSENFQALQLMQERYREQVKCVYIDPPYNTSSSAILYKNDYQHSSWCTLMRDRTELSRRMLKTDGAIFVSIDKTECTNLEYAMDEVFGSDNHIEELIWTQNTANSQLPNYATTHEYVEVYARDRKAVEQDIEMFREPKPGYAEMMDLIARIQPSFPTLAAVESEIRQLFDVHIASYKEELEASGREWDDDTKRQDPWRGIYPYNRAEYRDREGKFVPECEAKTRGAAIWIWREISPAAPASKQAASTRDPQHYNYRFYKPPHPVTRQPCPHPRGGWKFPYLPDPSNSARRSFVDLEANQRIVWGTDERKVPQTKGFLHEVETNIGTSVFYEYNNGEAELAEMFGESGLFLSPKSSRFVRKFVAQATKRDSLFIDFFGGSGSSAQAVISQNRLDHGARKYVLVEMGAHFDSLLLPRVLKVIHSSGWRNGKPIARDGISQCVKVIRLESYEDTLNNLRLHRMPEQESALQKADDRQRDEYLLGYFLDVESAGSASLLDLRQFRDPFAYKLNIATTSAGETRETAIDLVETFNWLIGLKVKHIDERKGFLTVTGEKRAGGRTLIIWRTLGDDVQSDNEALEKFLAKLEINPADTEFDFIYINGSHTLHDPHNKIHLIEEEFHRRMFESESFESLR